MNVTTQSETEAMHVNLNVLARVLTLLQLVNRLWQTLDHNPNMFSQSEFLHILYS